MICLIRHAKTKGNSEGRYIGKTDESISETLSLRRNYPKADIVITSGMKRTIETAGFIYPDVEKVIDARLAECDFGVFEGRNYAELKNDPRYVKWLESGGTLPFPGGEAHSDFVKRCTDGFFENADKYKGKNIAFVVHGGTVMAVMERLFGGGFYDYRVKNGSGFIITEENGKWLLYTML